MEHWISFRDAAPVPGQRVCVRWKGRIESGCFSGTIQQDGTINPHYEGIHPYMIESATHWCLYER